MIEDYIKKAKELCKELNRIVGRITIEKELSVSQGMARAIAKELRKENGVRSPNKRRPEATLCIGDTHAPFMHPRYVEFLKDVEAEWNCKRVVHLGDLVDLHAVSRHVTETNADSQELEHEKTMEQVKQITDAFPKAILTLGNHDSIVQRQAKDIGISASVYLKPFKEVYNLPEDWTVTESVIIDDVIYEHGIGSAGKYGAMNSATAERMSYVQGHAHSGGGCMAQANSRDLIFGLNVGCGIDVDAYAFAYGKPFKRKPTIGCGVVVSSSEAYFIPMDLDGRYKSQ